MSDLLTRAVANVIPAKLAQEKLKSEKKLRVYWGIDPTSSKIHLGHTIPMRKLQAFAAAGHEAILIIGSFTAMIGDPSDRDAIRTPLTREKVEENFQTYKEQAQKILDFKKVNVRYNHEWLEKLSFEDILKLASKFTVQQMLQRDMFKERRWAKARCPNCNEIVRVGMFNEGDPVLPHLRGDQHPPVSCQNCNQSFAPRRKDIIDASPIGLHEFLYPLMVGYDSVVLDVDCEIGGTDQEFNMLCGRTLQQAFKKRDKFVLTTHLIPGLDGRKMSKTYENCVYLSDAPADMYGKLMSLSDELIPLYMECCTDIPLREVQEVKEGIEGKEVNPKIPKMRLAREIVAMYHGGDAAAKAEAEFERVFKERGVPDDVPELKVPKGTLLVDALLQSGLASSKSEARRLIEQGGVSVAAGPRPDGKINDKIVKSVNAKIEEGMVKVGKRKFIRVQIM